MHYLIQLHSSYLLFEENDVNYCCTCNCTAYSIRSMHPDHQSLENIEGYYIIKTRILSRLPRDADTQIVNQ